MRADKFSQSTIEKLQYYVYRLVDPRSGATFYVGKGKGNRVFDHANGRLSPTEEEDASDLKSKIIDSIIASGDHVRHIIHRHGLTEDVAHEVEAALIDAYADLSNLQGGHGSGDRGVATANEIELQYAAVTAEFRHSAVLVNISQGIERAAVYEAARFAWRLDKRRASDCDFVMAISKGLIRGVYVAEQWLEANAENFPGRESMPGRWGFKGREAGPEIAEMYVGKRVPDLYRQRGAANPIRYCKP